MNQKFELTIKPRRPVADAMGFAREFQADLPGCSLQDAQSLSGGYELKLSLLMTDIDMPHTTDQLLSLLRPVTNRYGVHLSEVRQVKVGGVYQAINQKLGPAGRSGGEYPRPGSEPKIDARKP